MKLLAENLLATGCVELGRRAGEVLRLRRDAGIAVNHAALLEQNLGTEKPNLISALGLFQISLFLQHPANVSGRGLFSDKIA
jgi:hypothetical protein